MGCNHKAKMGARAVVKNIGWILLAGYVLGWFVWAMATAPHMVTEQDPLNIQAGSRVNEMTLPRLYMDETKVDWKEVGSGLLAVCIAPVALFGVIVWFIMLAIGKLFGVKYYDYPDAERITQ